MELLATQALRFNKKTGVLSKYKNFLLGWRNRFIKIDRSYVHDFEAQDAPNPADSLVRGEIVRCNCNISFKGAAGPYVFDVVTRSGHTWYLRAKTWSSNPDFGVFPGDPPAKNPNARQEVGECSSNFYSTNPGIGNNRNNQSQGEKDSFPPSYADLFDRHDPNVQKK